MKKIVDLSQMDARYTKRLNQIAIEIKNSYTEFVDFYSQQFGENYLWWALPLSSRNIYIDNTFLNVCYLYLCQFIIREEEVDEIIVPTEALCKTLCQNYQEEIRNNHINIRYKEKTKRHLYIYVKFLKSFFILYKVFCKIKLSAGVIHFNFENKVSFIELPVLSSGFQGKIYNDIYFTNILQYAPNNTFFIPDLNKNTSISWRKFICIVKKSNPYHFILKESFLHIQDYFELFKYLKYCIRMTKHRYMFQNMDVSELVYESLLAGSYVGPSLKGILNYHFIKRAKNKGMKIDNLISWYEGRPSDIMIHKAFREYYPESNCVGYEGLPLSEFALSQYLSREQLKKKSAPLKVAIPGKGYENAAKQFCREVECIRVPILRNRYENSRKKNEISSEKKKLLVILPYFVDYAGSMLCTLNRYLQMRPDSFEVIIKNHPVNIEKKIEDYTKEMFCFEPVYVKGELRTCLEDIDIAFISYSTASLEVICQGVYLINLCPLGQLRDTGIPDGIDDKLYKMVYDDKEVFEALDIFLQGKEEQVKSVDLTEWLEPVNKETVSRMWN